MPRREVPLVAEQHYHVYNRGNNKQPIFFEDENYLFFLRRLRKHLASVTVVAYCLMPNHYHLLLQPRDDDLSHRLQMFSISYTKAINERRQRVGALFQGAFQAKLVDRDEYLLHLSRYIHLNPVRAGLVQRPEDWDYSSYRDYIDLRDGTLPKPDIVTAQLPTRQAYRDFVETYEEGKLPKSDKLRKFENIDHLLFDKNE